jgi:hypothetical protein
MEVWLHVELAREIATTTTNPEVDRLPEFSPSFSVMNAQVTKFFLHFWNIHWRKYWKYKQENVILGNENPFGPTFDASIVYGPVFGQMYYVGLRFKIK